MRQVDLYHWMDVLNRSQTLNYFIYAGGDELEPDFNYDILLTTYEVVYEESSLRRNVFQPFLTLN